MDRYRRLLKSGTDCSAPRGKRDNSSDLHRGQSGLSQSFQQPASHDVSRRALLFAGMGAALANAKTKTKRMRVVDTKGEKVAVLCGDQAVLEYRYTAARPKTYVHPLVLPNGFAISYDSPPDHLHHQGLMLAWSSVNGLDFWGEKNPGEHGQIVHQKFLRLSDRGPAVIAALNHWVAKGKLYLVEKQTVRVPEPTQDLVRLDWESEITAQKEAITIDASKHPYNGLGIRFPHSMDFGKTLNSNGTTDFKKASGERAKWCAYTGSMGEGKGPASLAMFDAPENPRHPTPFFVMNDKFGYMSAAPSFHEGFTLKPGESLRFRWGVVAFAGEPDRAKLDALYTEWAAQKNK